MPFTDPCLGPTGVGVLDQQNNLTQDARDAFTAQVVLLLTSGNANGKGAKISTLLGIPFPPTAGVKVPDPDRLLTHPDNILGDLFWFDPSPFAPLTFDTLRDPEGGYQKHIVDFLYQPLMQALNLPGKGAPPLIDPTGILPPDISVKLKIPDLPKIAVAIPAGLPALAADLGIPEIANIPDLLLSIKPQLPSLPKLPPIPPDFDFIVFPKLVLELIKLPAVVLPNLVGQLAANPPTFFFPPSAPDLFDLCVKALFLPILELLKDLGLLLILPKLLVATFIVIIQNACAALAPLVISQIIGTGLIVKTIGQALGLA